MNKLNPSCYNIWETFDNCIECNCCGKIDKNTVNQSRIALNEKLLKISEESYQIGITAGYKSVLEKDIEYHKQEIERLNGNNDRRKPKIKIEEGLK